MTGLKRAVAVLTDSTSDIHPDVAEANGIAVVPLSVTFGSETFADGQLTQEEFFRRMATAQQLPTTSQPPVGVFVNAYEKLLETASEVVSIHISSKLSGTIETARQAAQQFAGQVHVFDSRQLSGGLALEVMAAARAAAEGMNRESVVRAAEEARDRVRMIVGLDRLDNLAKGGRIGAVSAFLGGLLNLKVTLTVDAEGKFQPVARTRGATAALQHTVDWVAAQMGDRARGSFLVLHAMSPGNAEWLKERLEAAFDVVELRIVEVGVVISTHTGTGWGVAVLPID